MKARVYVLVTGFEPFSGLKSNPSSVAVRRLGLDPECWRVGLRTARLPVDRDASPRRLGELLRRHRPEALLMTGVAVGREATCLERTAVNVFAGAGGRGLGRPIRRGGPDGLFATAPLGLSLRALRRGAPSAVLSESAGTFCCNLVFYEALRWSREGAPWGGPLPRWTAFVHVPATPDCGAPDGTPTRPGEESLAALRCLALEWCRRLGA